MKEKLVNYVDEVADKVQNVGQCKMAASAVNGLTEGDISMKTRVTRNIRYKKLLKLRIYEWVSQSVSQTVSQWGFDWIW